MIAKVIGMIGTIDGMVVSVETPGARPWYKVDYTSATSLMLTDGEYFCWRVEEGITDVFSLAPAAIERHRHSFVPFFIDSHEVVMREVHNAIKLYVKEIWK